VNVQGTNTQVTLVHASDRPGNDFYPQVKVDWQLSNTRPCFAISKATVTATLKIGGKTYQEKKSANGTSISSMTLLFDSVAVGSNFVPDQVTALVEASGTALLTGTAAKEIQVN
jgi:hypothetical protein